MSEKVTIWKRGYDTGYKNGFLAGKRSNIVNALAQGKTFHKQIKRLETLAKEFRKLNAPKTH